MFFTQVWWFLIFFKSSLWKFNPIVPVQFHWISDKSSSSFVSLSSPIASRRVESAVLRLLPSTKTSSSSSVTIAGMLIFTRVGDSKALVKLENEIDFHHKLCEHTVSNNWKGKFLFKLMQEVKVIIGLGQPASQHLSRVISKKYQSF